jgi:putative ATP-binding cassette transporter
MYKSIYKAFFQKNPKEIFFFSALGLITGLVNAYLIMFINQLIQKMIVGEHIFVIYSSVVFLSVVACFFLLKKMLFTKITHFTQRSLLQIRAEMLRLILQSEYPNVNERKELIYNVLTRDIDVIASAGTALSEFISSLVLVLGCFCYVAYISPVLFLTTLAIFGVGVLLYYYNLKFTLQVYQRVKGLNDRFIFYFNQIISGFREIKVAKEKGLDLEENYVKENLKELHDELVKVGAKNVNVHFIGIAIFYLFIGGILLLGIPVFHLSKEQLIPFAFVMLYVISPIESLIVNLPAIGDADVASERLLNLRVTLQDSIPCDVPVDYDFEGQNFLSLELVDVKFQHKSPSNQFEVGPVSLQLNAGELTFIHGSNGSGKTSLLLCLLGVYKFDSGTMLINKKPLSGNHSTLFSPVFSDYFLFDLFYGNKYFNRDKAAFYIQLFELENKVRVSELGFSTIKLSMGQRKRLALIQILLENKPIVVLDEWAADQDPYFREKFYSIILPILKKEGKTIIAITHDDKYFHLADHLLKMEFGKLFSSKIL